MRGRCLATWLVAFLVLSGSAIADDKSECFSDAIDKGIAACTRLIEASDQQANATVSARHQRALHYIAMRQHGSAMADLDEVLRLDAKNFEVLTDRASLRCQQKNYRGATADFATALTNGAPLGYISYNRGICHLDQRKSQQAVVDFEAATRYSPTDGRAYFGLYVAYSRLKDNKRAIDAHYVAIQTGADAAGTALEFRYSNDLQASSGGGGGGKKKKKKKGKKKGHICPGYAPWDPQRGECVNDKTKQVVTTHEIRLFFGTDRSQKSADGKVSFGKEAAGRVTLGRADVSVPVYRRVGEIERPWTLTSTALHIIGKSENPVKYYVIGEVSDLDKPTFIQGVSDALVASDHNKGQAFVFIHGYNVSFPDALYRAAQIAADSGFDGVPFVYSWPSAGELIPYADDRKSAARAIPHLRTFLETIASETSVEKVHIIAHSMGSVVAVNALKLLAEEMTTPARRKFSEIILAAPDFDTEAFREILATMGTFGEGKTLYASSQDLALKASMAGWGGERAGNVPIGGPLVMRDIATVDVSAVNTNILGHSTYADEMKLLIDIGILLRGRRDLFGAPKNRIPLLYSGTAPGGAYWIWPR